MKISGPKHATLTGLAVGDALGMPFEMMASTASSLTSWRGDYQDSLSTITANLKAGQWTDDTKMAIALSESLLAEGTYSPADAARRYLAWLESGDLRGIGTTTGQALARLQAGLPWTQSGVSGSEGNGTAMRVAPLGLFFRTNLQAAAEMAAVDADITHRSKEAREASIAVAVAVAVMAQGRTSKEDLILKVLEWLGDSQIKARLRTVQAQTRRPIPLAQTLERLVELGTGAHVIQTVPAAFFAFVATTSFQEAVELAIRAGGDTDTTGAVTGALAGTWYGIEQVAPYADKVEDGEHLRELEQRLYGAAREVYR